MIICVVKRLKQNRTHILDNKIIIWKWEGWGDDWS